MTITLAHFPNGRDRLRRCYDCWDLLAPGEGIMQARYGRKKLVCRDREACKAERISWDARRGTGANSVDVCAVCGEAGTDPCADCGRQFCGAHNQNDGGSIVCNACNERRRDAE